MIEENGFLIALYSEKTIVVQIAVTNKPHKFIISSMEFINSSGKHNFYLSSFESYIITFF